MTDYYTELRPAVEAKVKDLAARRDELTSQRAALRKKIAETEAYIERVRGHVTELEGLAGQALVEGQNSYSKYQTSLRDRTTELFNKEHELAGLKTALAQVQEEFAVAERRLNDGLRACAHENRHICAERATEHLDRAVAEIDDWIDGWTRLAGDYGEGFRFRDSVPGLEHPRIDPRMPGLFVAMRAEERLQRLQENQEKG